VKLSGLAAEMENAGSGNQFDNLLKRRVTATAGQSGSRQTAVDAWIASTGTGGTLAGVAMPNPAIKRYWHY